MMRRSLRRRWGWICPERPHRTTKIGGSFARVVIGDPEKEGRIKWIVHHSAKLIYSKSLLCRIPN